MGKGQEGQSHHRGLINSGKSKIQFLQNEGVDGDLSSPSAFKTFSQRRKSRRCCVIDHFSFPQSWIVFSSLLSAEIKALLSLGVLFLTFLLFYSLQAPWAWICGSNAWPSFPSVLLLPAKRLPSQQPAIKPLIICVRLIVTSSSLQRDDRMNLEC